jgi:hypothetical protein
MQLIQHSDIYRMNTKKSLRIPISKKPNILNLMSDSLLLTENFASCTVRSVSFRTDLFK